MQRTRSPRRLRDRHRQHRLILALYLVAALAVLVTWLTNAPQPV